MGLLQERQSSWMPKPCAGLLTEKTLDWKLGLKYKVTGDILTFLHLFFLACSVVCVFGPQQPAKAVTRHEAGAMLAFS